MRRYDLDLWNVENIGEMFRTVLDNLRRSPKSMFLHRKSGRSSDIECYHLPNYMDSGVYQHAIVGFAYADVRDLGAVTLDICFGWRLPLDDHELATIFTAVSEIALIDRIQWLLLVDWNTTPEGSWCALLQ
jgi:hypothetical protein